MPCGVETTRQIVETIRTADKPLTIKDICHILNRSRSVVRDGMTNIKEIGYDLDVKAKTPRLVGRPELTYAIRPEVFGQPDYFGPK